MPRIQVILSEDEHQCFKRVCEAQGRSMSGVLADWVRANVEKAEPPGQGTLFPEHAVVVALSLDEFQRFAHVCDGLAKSQAALMHSWVRSFLMRMEKVAQDFSPAPDLFHGRTGK